MKVKELIELLSKVDGELEVEIGMNQEYQEVLDSKDVRVERFDFYNEGKPFLFLGN